jgi:hypothetical protein
VNSTKPEHFRRERPASILRLRTVEQLCMRAGLLVTIGVGLAAILLRAYAPAPVADVSAVVYLIAATSTFGSRLLIPRRARP